MYCKNCECSLEGAKPSYIKLQKCSSCHYEYYKIRTESKIKQYSKVRNDNYYKKPECRRKKLDYCMRRQKENKERWYAYCKERRQKQKNK